MNSRVERVTQDFINNKPVLRVELENLLIRHFKYGHDFVMLCTWTELNNLFAYAIGRQDLQTPVGT